MRYLFLLFVLPFVLLPNCGGRASSPRGSGGEGGTDSGSTETGGSGSGGKGSSTGGGRSTGGTDSGGATGGAGGENQSGARTIEIHFHNNRTDNVYLQLVAHYCPAFGFAHLGEDDYGDPVYVSVGSSVMLGDEFGFVECAGEGECSYVESILDNLPSEVPEDFERKDASYYRKVSPGEEFALYLRAVEEKDIARLRATEDLNVVLGSFDEGDKEWICREGADCDCDGYFCTIREEPPYDWYHHDYEFRDVACSPEVIESYGSGIFITVNRIEWDRDPIQVHVSRLP